jgi:hypothetical protein
MSSQKRVLRSALGVELVEISLINGGQVAARGYNVKTLRTPESWSFDSLAEANARYLDELSKSESDPLVQQRLNR